MEGFVENRFENFTVLITKISRAIRRIKTEEMAEFDLKSPHVSCLYYIYKNRQLTAKELCDLCDEDKSAISRSLVFLEDEGFLECDSKTIKKYKAPITLTKKGEEIGKIIDGKIDKIVDMASLGLNDEDRGALYRALSIISDNLENVTNNYGGNYVDKNND